MVAVFSSLAYQRHGRETSAIVWSWSYGLLYQKSGRIGWIGDTAGELTDAVNGSGEVWRGR